VPGGEAKFESFADAAIGVVEFIDSTAGAKRSTHH